MSSFAGCQTPCGSESLHMRSYAAVNLSPWNWAVSSLMSRRMGPLADDQSSRTARKVSILVVLPRFVRPTANGPHGESGARAGFGWRKPLSRTVRIAATYWSEGVVG